MSKLYVLSEDTVGIAEYLARNGLYPSAIYFNTGELLDQLPYASEDTLFLVIIHGFSRFNPVEINRLLESFKSIRESNAPVMFMTDIMFKSSDLINSGIEFILYTGDLFFGKYQWFVNNKATRDTDTEDAIVADILNGRVREDKAKNTTFRTDFWEQFGEFTDPSVKPIMGTLPAERSDVVDSDSRYIGKLVSVNLNLDTDNPRD